MIPGYKQQFLNGIAYQRLNAPIFTPATSLNVEDYDEYQGSYKMLVTHHNKQPGPVYPNPASAPYEKVGVNLRNDKLHDNDFPKAEFFGNPIMGI
ncbi:hypothetical protein ABE244_25605 [Bacillus toyonensis]|uniref:hypothetical protein n=1 Tax=Bacillus toyonensis TaxID=155322 RepID=UPI003D1D32A1